MADRMQLEIVTPERVVISEKVDEVTAPGYLGEFGVLPDHTPFLTILQIGLLSYRQGEDVRQVAVSGGFAEILENKVVILARTAEYSDEIDVERAQKARERAEDALKDLSVDDEHYAKFEAKLNRAMIRIQASS